MTPEQADEEIQACLVKLRGLMRTSGKSYHRMTFTDGTQEDSIAVERWDGDDLFHEDVRADETLGDTHALLFQTEES